MDTPAPPATAAADPLRRAARGGHDRGRLVGGIAGVLGPILLIA